MVYPQNGNFHGAMEDDTSGSCGSIMFGWPEESESAEVDEACHGGLDCWAMST
jgi:hypothetical protein